MYKDFYKLSSLPFQLTPDARFFYESKGHRQAMSYLVYGLHHAEGFIVITGEVGAGKTMLVENLLSTIPESEFIVAKIVTTQLAGDDLLRMVAAGFGIGQENVAKGSLLKRIDDFIASQRRTGKRAVLIVDEAQNLPFAALEELRMLSNLMSGKSPALQSFLLGQPQFRAVLANPELEQLRQRVTAAYHLGPLDEAETRSYIEHRLRLAAWQDDPTLADDCYSQIYKFAGGVPRRINILCSRLLLYGFLESLHTLTGADVEQVGGDLDRELAFVRNDRVISGATVDKEVSLPAIAQQLVQMERILDRHERIIKQVIAIAVRYLQDQQS